VCRLQHPHFEQLPRVVPLIQRLRRLQSLVTLQTNQVGAQRARDGTRQRCLADARLAFEEQRTFEADRKKQRDREAVIGDVVLLGKPLLQVGDGFRKNASPLSAGWTQPCGASARQSAGRHA
jgi:hypothetical protein